MEKTPLEQFRAFFMEGDQRQRPGHFGRLGFRCQFIEIGRAGLDLPFSPELVGDPATGAVAGGPMTALLDSCCALAAATAREPISFCPTLDLRMDHMGLAEPGKTLHAEAEAYRVTQSVIFTRGIIFQEDRSRPIVHGLVNFTPIAFKIGGAPQGRDQEGEGE
ncbi:PaaI family thioesterase [Proteobacteria bacterium 005FR1]|nr:PaaI family thioesterase [Proteobacteria bacterium 005FR1]